MASEEEALKRIVAITDEIRDVVVYIEKEGGMPAVVLLSILIRLTREYADKCDIRLDRVMAGLVSAGKKEEVDTCTT